MLNIFKRKIKPVAEGYLPEEDGHKVYWARYGNVKGKTILQFHGGPGASSKPYYAQIHNLKKYNVIIFDQRGCGKSEPAGKIENNNKGKIISDAKRILDVNGLQKAIIQGGSWGSTLALCFSEKYPKMVEKIIVSDVFLGRKEDDEWCFSEKYMGKCYPDLHEKLMRDVPKNKSVAKHYLSLITSKKQPDVKKAMEGFANYEGSIGELEIDINREPNYKKLNSKKVFLHYMKDNYFVKGNEILDNVKNIVNKPCLILHNRLDILCPLQGAWDLNKAMKKSKLVILPVLGHNVFRSESMKKVKKEIAEFLDK